MPKQTLKNYKTVLYQLCDLLIRKKLSIEGKGLIRPIAIPLSELREVAYFSHKRTADEKIAEVKKELLDMAKDSLEVDGPPVLKIENPEILESLTSEPDPNKSVFLIYSRKGIADYQKTLLEGDKIIEEAADYELVVFNPEAFEFRYHGKKMEVRKNQNDNITANLCLLMFGFEADFEGQPRISNEIGEEYRVGDEVDIDVLIELIFTRHEHEQRSGRTQYVKKISDAQRNLNKRATLKLGTELFSYENQKLKVLPVA